MPLMNGADATRRIRQLGYTGQIIGVTGTRIYCIHCFYTSVPYKNDNMNTIKYTCV